MVGVHLEGDVPSPVGLLLDLCGRHFAQPLAQSKCSGNPSVRRKRWGLCRHRWGREDARGATTLLNTVRGGQAAPFPTPWSN